MGRIYAFDFIKFFAIYLVVCVHTITYQGNGEINEFTSLMIVIFPRFVIPFFFIVSGFLFAQKLKTYINKNKYFLKYIFRIAILFGCWFILYFVYDIVLTIVLAAYLGLDLKAALIDYLNIVLKPNVIYYGMGVTSFHLWYLTSLIWSIIILFLCNRFWNIKSLLIFSLVLNLIGLFGQTYSGIYNLPIQTRDALFLGLFYTTLGFYISVNSKRINDHISRTSSKLLICFVFLFSCTQIIERMITVNFFNTTNGSMDYYLSTIPLTLSLFLLAMKNMSFGKNSIFTKVGRNTVGIYVSHMFFVSSVILLLNFLGIESIRGFFVFNLVFPLLVIIISYYFFGLYIILIRKLYTIVNYKTDNKIREKINLLD